MNTKIPAAEATIRNIQDIVNTEGRDLLLKISGKRRLNEELHVQAIDVYNRLIDECTRGLDRHNALLTGIKRTNNVIEVKQPSGDLVSTSRVTAARQALDTHEQRMAGEAAVKANAKADDELAGFEWPAVPLETLPSLLNEGVVGQVFPVKSVVVVEYGKAYRGDPDGNDTIMVAVTMRPYLYASKRGTWSWRTMVAGFTDYRHINVANLHSVLRDSDGQYFVKVDQTWETDQPVFAALCNK